MTKDSDLDIDFVIPWVDGSDPEWLAEFNKYAPVAERREIDCSEKRYRDYGLLRYWFRGVEKFAPWVRTVHFVTCGQKPDWLNLDAPKLHWVKHSDYIRAEYLPVFSANPIEIGMRAIPDLAEHFVYFNDDFFLTAPVRKNFFFRNGLPCDAASLNIIPTTELMGHIILNNLDEINRHFKTHSVIGKSILKWLNPKYGVRNFRTLFLLPWPRFSGFYDPHFAQPYTKLLLKEVWENCEEALSHTMSNRFRSASDVNQWLFRYWMLCKGEFYPHYLEKHRKYFNVDESADEIVYAIKLQKYQEIVLNDADVADYDATMMKIAAAFDEILPEKSSFEV